MVRVSRSDSTEPWFWRMERGKETKFYANASLHHGLNDHGFGRQASSDFGEYNGPLYQPASQPDCHRSRYYGSINIIR